MSIRFDRNAKLFVFILTCLATALVSAACAALPPPRAVLPTPRTDSFTTFSDSERQTYILPPNVPVATVEATLTDFFANLENTGQTESIGHMPDINANYYNGLPLTTDGVLLWPINLDISDGEFADALLPHLIGRVGVSCVQSGEKAFWILDKTAISSLLEDLDPNSELGQSVASCGEECQDCGCIGPMHGPTCSAFFQPLYHPVIGDPTR